LPGGDVVGQAGYGLELIGFESCAGDLGFCRELRGIEEAAEWDRDSSAEQGAEFGDELVLMFDPYLIGGGMKSKQAFAADAGDGVAGDEGEKRVPLQGRCVEVLDGRGNGVEKSFLQRHDLVMVSLWRLGEFGTAYVAGFRVGLDSDCACLPLSEISVYACRLLALSC
jgi:hypothetical protein